MWMEKLWKFGCDLFHFVGDKSARCRSPYTYLVHENSIHDEINLLRLCTLLMQKQTRSSCSAQNFRYLLENAKRRRSGLFDNLDEETWNPHMTRSCAKVPFIKSHNCVVRGQLIRSKSSEHDLRLNYCSFCFIPWGSLFSRFHAIFCRLIWLFLGKR